MALQLKTRKQLLADTIHDCSALLRDLVALRESNLPELEDAVDCMMEGLATTLDPSPGADDLCLAVATKLGTILLPALEGETILEEAAEIANHAWHQGANTEAQGSDTEAEPADAELERIQALLDGHCPVNQETVDSVRRFQAALAQRMAETEGICWYHQTFQAVIEDVLSKSGHGDIAEALINWTLDRSGWSARYAVK